MTLKELLQLTYNSGLDGYENEQTFSEWWEKYGKDRHDAWMQEDHSSEEKP